MPTELTNQGLMAHRRGVVVGIANSRSLAWGIAKQARAQGADLLLTYQTPRLQKNVEGLAEELGIEAVLECDLGNDDHLQRLGERANAMFGGLDFVVHAAAFARREELQGRFIETSRAGFDEAMQASCYSLTALTRTLLPLLEKGVDPSVLTLTYLGSERALPNYNVMGVAKAALEASVRYLAQDVGQQNIRVNAISAGPVRTLSAAAISGLKHMLDVVETQSPLRRNVDMDDVGRAALFVLSSLARGMTGEIVHIDNGYHIVGAPIASPKTSC